MAAHQDEDEFLQGLRATFRLEAREHLQMIGSTLLALEKPGPRSAQAEALEHMFRAAHSLKGAARSVDLREIESRCQVLEDLFAGWKRMGRVPPGALDAAHRALDGLSATVMAEAAATAEPAMPARPSRRGPAQEETVRVAVSKLAARLGTAEEMLTAKLAAARRAEELARLGEGFETWRRQWHAVAPGASALRHALARAGPGQAHDAEAVRELLDFLDYNADHVRQVEGAIASLARAARQDRHTVGQLVDDLLEESKSLLLLPFGAITAALPRLVRDLCRELGKSADFVVRGGDVEVDRRVVEAMKDPLVHLLRNSIDHGIETPQARAAAGKPARAAIVLTATRIDDKVSLQLADDGCGIDADKVRRAAVAQGLLTPEQAAAVPDQRALDLAFSTGVSTSPAVTRLSGRGLGLAIVREKAEAIGGSVTVSSEPGRGTTVTMLLPATLATFRGIVVEAAGALLVAPSGQVERVTRAKAADIVAIEGRETLPLDGRCIPLVPLARALEMAAPAARASEAFFAMVVGAGEHRIAFEVDAVIDELEVLVKPLVPPLRRVRNIAGATVLASGQIAAILNVPDLLKSARKAAGTAPRAPAAVAREKAARSILVAEDSITSRMLLKGILEAAGYQVRTAADGMEAFALLRSYRFDALVSDVDMPRLNGIALTAKVRADSRLADLPVVLVTTLGSAEDRERGIDAGANAYIVKSRFDQSDLLDAVRRVIR